MRPLEIEKWIESKKKQYENSQELLIESIIAYKAGAYRAAYIMSWLFFVSAIKERFLKIPNCPQDIPEESWKLVRKWFTDENYWDFNVMKALLRENLNKEEKDIEKIFNVPSDLPTLIKAYRKYRNICAHGKDYTISYSHVEAFWGFIMDALSKITITGEIEVFVDRLVETFNKFGVDNDKLVGDLLSQALQVVSADSFQDFLEMLDSKLEEKDMSEMTRHKVFVKIYEIIQNFSKRDPKYAEYSEELVKYVIQSTKIDTQVFAGLYPESLRDILSQRPIYAEELLTLLERAVSTEEEMPPYILPQCLELALMDLAYLQEDTFNKLIGLVKKIPYILTNWNVQWVGTMLSQKPELVEILDKHGFFDNLKRVILDKVIVPKGFNFTTANERSLLPTIYIKHKGLDEDLVKKMVIVFSDKDEHYPYRVKDALEDYFKTNTEKWDEFKQIFQKLNESGAIEISLEDFHINPEKADKK
ncbi:hypothetical protein A3L11_09865 [Thermococcus siculi]|uniref:Uncharacterized protein n=1 Tax=Thermococcus siculi TaxID=72803 RepID=A0A2Z2MMB2_9EURY|nr:hypothetical protein [Thermococcus siculi]ASJ09519.1 hypothetical protein A3L11_09865 [Thermococcus siculi]